MTVIYRVATFDRSNTVHYSFPSSAHDITMDKI